MLQLQLDIVQFPYLKLRRHTLQRLRNGGQSLFPLHPVRMALEQKDVKLTTTSVPRQKRQIGEAGARDKRGRSVSDGLSKVGKSLETDAPR